MSEQDFKGLKAAASATAVEKNAIIKKNFFKGKSIKLEVVNEDILELGKHQEAELTTQELAHFQNKPQKISLRKSSKKKEGIEDIPSTLMKQICAK